jgi:hypothetical protein
MTESAIQIPHVRIMRMGKGFIGLDGNPVMCSVF